MDPRRSVGRRPPGIGVPASSTVSKWVALRRGEAVLEAGLEDLRLRMGETTGRCGGDSSAMTMGGVAMPFVCCSLAMDVRGESLSDECCDCRCDGFSGCWG